MYAFAQSWLKREYTAVAGSRVFAVAVAHTTHNARMYNTNIADANDCPGRHVSQASCVGRQKSDNGRAWDHALRLGRKERRMVDADGLGDKSAWGSAAHNPPRDAEGHIAPLWKYSRSCGCI